MMKATVYDRYGLPDVLQFKEVDKPVIKDDEVLVRVCASSINSWDWDLLKGSPYIVRLGGLTKPKFKILGADIAGIIEAVGKNVTKFKVGDEVFGDLSAGNWGGFGEYVNAAEKALALKSPRMTFAEAAAIPQAGVLALQALNYNGIIKKGQKILINGAGGGVGTFAIQMAKTFGAEVTAVDSSEKLKLLRALGADHVIDYTEVDFTKTGECYDLILDVFAYRSIADYKRALKPNGVCVFIGGIMSKVLPAIFFGSLIDFKSGKKIGVLMHKPNPADLVTINNLFETGKVKPIIDRVYPANKVADALTYFGTARMQGKVVITFDKK